MIARTTDGLEARLRARTAERRRVLDVSRQEAEAEFTLAEALANRLTGYMVSQLRLRFTRGGFNWLIGFFAEDFVGKINPFTGETITAFYPVYVVKGTRFQTGNDFLTTAHRLRRLERLRAYKRALEG